MSNTISVTGRIAVQPELKFAASGVAYLALAIPDQKRKKNDAGQWEDASATTWFRATVFGEVAELIGEKANKGDEVTVTGRLISREYEGKNGPGVSLEIDNARVAWHGPSEQRQPAQSSGWGGAQQPASDPWATSQQPAQGGGFGDEAPF